MEKTFPSIKATLLRFLSAHPDELSFLLLLLLTNLLLKVGTEMVDNIAEMIFVRRVGVEQLPTLFAIEPVIMVLILLVAGKLLDRVNRHLFFIGANLVFILILGLTYLFVLSGGTVIYYVLFVLQRIFFVISGIVFWLVANDLVDIGQAKRLFAAIIAAGIGGKLLGNLLTAMLALLLSAEVILLVAGLLFVGCIVTILWLRRLDVPGNAGPIRETTEESISLFLPQRLLKLPFVQAFIWLSIVVSVGDTVLRYELNTVLNQSLQNEQSLIATYSLFKTGAGVLVFLFQALLAGHLMRQLGVPGSLNIQPVATIAGLLLISVMPHLFVVASTVALLSMLHFGFYTAARKTTVNIFPADERGRFSAFSKQLIYLGKLLGALLLFVVANRISLVYLSWLAAGLIVSWFLFLPRFRRKYVEACLEGGRLPLDKQITSMLARRHSTTTRLQSFQQTLNTAFPQAEQSLALSVEGFKLQDEQISSWIFSTFSKAAPHATTSLQRALRSPNLFVRQGARQLVEQSSKSAEALKQAIEFQLKDAFELELLTAPLRKVSKDNASVWQKLCREKQIACQTAILTLLAEIYPPDQIRIVARMLQSQMPLKKSMGVEALDSMLQGKLKSGVLTLVASQEDDREKYAIQQLGLLAPDSTADALQKLVTFPDSSVLFWALHEARQQSLVSNGFLKPDDLYSYRQLPSLEAVLLFGSSTIPELGEVRMELAQKINVLRAIEAFGRLGEDELRVAALCLRERNFEADQIIFAEGQPGDEFYVIIEGHVELASVARKQTIQALGANHTFGDVSLFSGRPHTLTAVTISPTRILSLEQDVLRELMHYYPNVALGLMQGLAEQVDRMTTILQIQSEV